MSRCQICNVVLTTEELTHKDPLNGKYTDTCFQCLLEEEHLSSDVSEQTIFVQYDEEGDGLDDCGVDTTDYDQSDER